MLLLELHSYSEKFLVLSLVPLKLLLEELLLLDGTRRSRCPNIAYLAAMTVNSQELPLHARLEGPLHIREVPFRGV